jgi:cyclic beta-1,2-glucan synthetase
MFDNLRRSLVAPMSLALLLLALAGLGLSPWAALALVLAAFAAGPLMGAWPAVPSRDDCRQAHFYRQAAIDLLRALLGGLWHLGQLLQQALMAWTPSCARCTACSSAAATCCSGPPPRRRRPGRALRPLLRRHGSEPLVALVLLRALWAAGTPTPALALALCALWAPRRCWTWWVSRRGRRAARPLPRPTRPTCTASRATPGATSSAA